MSHHPRPEGRTEAKRAVVQRANQIKLNRRRHLGNAVFESRLFTMRHIQQAVSLIRRRGTAADRKLLPAAGYAESKPKR